MTGARMTREQIVERCRVLAGELEILEREVDDAYIAGYFGAALCALSAAEDYLGEPDDGADEPPTTG